MFVFECIREQNARVKFYLNIVQYLVRNVPFTPVIFLGRDGKLANTLRWEKHDDPELHLPNNRLYYFGEQPEILLQSKFSPTSL